MEDPDLSQSPRKRLKLDRSHVTTPDTSTLPTETVMDPSDILPLSAVVTDVNMADEHHETLVNPHDVSQRKELQVGIKELLNPNLPGFSGILKKRYTDFIVNEILPSGQVVHLDNLKPPKPPKGAEEETHAETLALADVSVSHTQSGPAIRSAQLEKPQDASLSSLDETASQALGQNAVHVNEGLLESSPNVTESVSEVKSVAAPKSVGDGEVQIPQEKPEEAPKEAPQEMIGPNTSANAFPEPNKDLNHWQAFAKDQPAYQLSDTNSELLKSYFDSEVVKELLVLFNRVVDSPHRKVKEYGVVNAGKIADRAKRTKIHQDLRKIFSSRLESATDENGAMIVTAAVSTGSMDGRNDREGRGQGRGRGLGRGRGGRGGSEGGFKRGQQSRRLTWQELGGEYLHFTIYKENKDTMEVIGYLTRQLHMKPQGFQFAGTKDRRAITVQRASVHRVRAEQMASVGRTLRYSYVGNYQYQKQGLDLGDLLGNEFVITLRDCQFEGLVNDDTKQRVQLAQKIVQDAAEHLGNEGFINYYGLQRFGTFATRTDAVGLKMLQGDFKGAVASILEFAPETLVAAKDPVSSDATISSDDKARAWAIDSFQRTGKSHPALDELPRKFSAEASIIRHLGNLSSRTDFRGALQFIPRNLRLMYVHAYQSLVWNLAASKRWARFGKEIVEGDLVLVNEHKKKINANDAVEAGEELDSDGGVIIHPAAHDSSRSEEDRFERARALTAEEVKSGQYTIFDVVLPTPGFDVLYPTNEVGNFYATFMKSEEGGNLDPDDMRRTWKDVSLSGNYRKLIARPLKAVEVEVKAYLQEDEQFVETDMDVLKKKKQLDQAQSTDGNAAGPEKATSKDDGDDGETTLAMVDHPNVAESSTTKPHVIANHEPQTSIDQAMPDADAIADGRKKMAGSPLSHVEGIAPSGAVDGITANEVASAKPTPQLDETAESHKIAVILKLQLGSSQYATMALRELMKHGGVRTYKPDFGTGR